jgi:hypothetical protein
VSRPAIEITEFIDRILAGRASTEGGFRFGVLADLHIWGSNQLWADGEVRECLARCRDAGAAFVFVVGDLGTTETEVPREGGRARLPDVFNECVAAVEGCPPVFFSIGNHEPDGEGKSSWLRALYPGAFSDLEGSANERFFYYSFDFGGCHFVALDSHGTVPGAPPMCIGDGPTHFARLPEEELAWLRQDLERHRGRLTFVFMHEPVVQITHESPWHLLQNRGRLLGELQRFPNVQWVFQGHIHHHSQVSGYGLNLCHVGRRVPQLVEVDGETAELFDLLPGGVTTPVQFAGVEDHERDRWARRDGRVVYRLAENGPQSDRSLFESATVVVADRGITPPEGQGTMIRVSQTLERKEPGQVQDLYGYLAMDFILPIYEGMTFEYQVHWSAGAPHDHFALVPIINTAGGEEYGMLRDQEGLPIDTHPERPLDSYYNLGSNDGRYCAPSLEGRATGVWWRRVCDLSHLAGGWIVGVVACASPPLEKAVEAGALRFYLSDISLTWPA